MNRVHGKQYRIALLDPQGQVLATGERLRLRDLERSIEQYQIVILPPGHANNPANDDDVCLSLDPEHVAAG